MNKIIEFLSAFEPFVQFKHNKLGKITSSTDIDTIDCGYIWEKDYDDNLHCKVDDRFDIIKICLNNEWLDTTQVLKQYFNTLVSKFKDTQQLLKAYEALEKEFTKRSQRVADTEAKLKILQNGIIDDETLRMLVRAHPLYKDLEAKLAEKEIHIVELEDKDWYEGTIKQLEEQNERLINERDTLVNFINGQWIDAKLIQKLLQIDFSEGTSKFAFSRNAEWWSIVGKTEEERSRNGQKITTVFKLDENKSARKVISDLEHFVVSNLTYVAYRGDNDFDDFIKQLKDKYGDYSL